MSDDIRLDEALQVLRDADRRKDAFLRTVAWELREQLGFVSNAATLLREQKLADREVERARSMIERQLDHLWRLAGELFDLSRMRSGGIKLRCAPVRLDKVIGAAVKNLEPFGGTAGRHLAVNVPKSFVIDGDEQRLVQIFRELLLNAIKYTAPDGHVSLSAERLEREVVVRVTDDGRGIAAQHLPHIFELFYTAESPVERLWGGGLGVGLTLVHHLVGLHGGTVEVRSDGSGKGSEFTVSLPLAPEGVLPESEIPVLQCTILIVDDNKDEANALGALLAGAGAFVFTAHDGEKALVLAGRARPDVVFLDTELPDMNAHDVARGIRRGWGSNAVLIALTGSGQEGDREQAGFDHCLVKPVNL